MGASAELKDISLWIPFFFWLPSIFLHTFQEATSALRMLNMLLARILPLFVYKDANRMLGNTVPFQCCYVPIITFVGHSFLNNAPSLEIYITFLVDLHVCGQRNNSMFSKRPRDHIVSAPPLSPLVC